MAGSLLGDLTVSFKVDLSGLTSGISQAKSEMSGIGSTASSASSAVSSGFGGAIGSLVQFGAQVGQTVFGLQNLFHGAVDLAQGLLQPAATAETTQLSFETLLHSTQAAHAEMVSLNTFAASTPMQTQWVDNAAAKILAFGGTTKDVIPEITAIGDSLSGLGKLSDASLNSIVDIFGKISAQGKLTGGDMMQLSTWGVPAWSALSQAMGKSIPELQKMVSAGLIPASKAIPALEQGMEKTFGGGMAKQANTFTGLMSTLASNWQIAMAAIGGPALKLAEQGLSKVGDLLASSGFQGFATNVGQKIADAFSRIGTMLGGVATGGSGILNFFQQIAQGWQSIGWDAEGNSVLPAIVAAFGRLQQAAQQFGATIGGPLLSTTLLGINALLTTLAGWIMSLVAPALDMMAQRTNALTAFLRPVLTAILPFTTSLINLTNAIGPVVVGIMTWVSQSGILTPIMGALGSVLGGLITSLAGIITWIAQLAFFFEQNQVAGDLLIGVVGGLAAAFISIQIAAIAPLVAGFISMIPAMIGLVGMILGGAVPALGAMAIAAWAAIAPLLPFIAIGVAIAAVIAGIILAVQHWGEIVKWLQGAWSGTVSWFQGLWAGIVGIFGGIGAWFKNVFGQAGAGIQSTVKGWGAGIQSTVGGWGAGIQSALGGIGAGAQSGLKQSGAGIQSALGAVGGFFTSTGQKIGAGWQATMSGVVAGGQWMYNHNYYVKDAVDASVSAFNISKAAISSAWTATSSWITVQWQSFAAFSGSTWNTITSAIGSAWNRSASAVGTTWHGISQTASTAWTQTSNVVQQKTSQTTTWLSAQWTTASNWLGVQWKGISTVASSVWGVTSTAISQATTASTTWLSAQWTTASNWLGVQWNKLAGFASVAWAAVSAVFASIWTTYISKPLGSLWTQISNWFTGLANGAKQAGANFINMLVQGINAGAGAIWNAVVGIAHTIWTALGFHSPPAGGPAKDSDRWMPNFIDMLSSTLVASTPKLALAVQTTAQPLTHLVQPSAAALGGRTVAATAQMAAASAGNSGDTHVHIYLDGQEMTQAVGNRMMRELRKRTGMKV